MTNDIQRARDVLAEWREGMTPGPWRARSETPTMSGAEWTIRTEGTPGIRLGVHEYQHGSTNLALIVGTAGNPDLLDAIDGMLATAAVQQFTGPVDHVYQTSAALMAAAIIAADERMSA